LIGTTKFAIFKLTNETYSLDLAVFLLRNTF